MFSLGSLACVVVYFVLYFLKDISHTLLLALGFAFIVKIMALTLTEDIS